MTSDDDFELDEPSGRKEPGPRPSGEPPRDRPPPPRPAPGPAAAGGARSRTRVERPGARAGSAPASAAAASTTGARTGAEPSEPGRGRLPLLFAPNLVLLIGTVLLAVLWVGGFFTPGGSAGAWPWETLLAADGTFTFAWDAGHVLPVLGVFFVAFFLVAALLPPSRSRGIAVLAVTALGLTTFPPSTTAQMLALAAVLLAVGAGALLRREGVRAGRGGRGLVFASATLLGANLFLPVGPSADRWVSLGTELYRALALDSTGRGAGEILLEPATALLLHEALVLLLCLLVLLGARGRGIVWAAGLALLVGTLGPVGLSAREVLEAGGSPELREFLQGVVGGLPTTALAFVLPLAAGVTDTGRPGR